MSRRVFNLVHEAARSNALDCIRSAPSGYRVTVGEQTRNLEQNAKLHAIFGDLAAQATHIGRKLTAQQWKTLIISGHAIATGIGADMVPGLEGEYVNVRESSASMSVSRMASVIEYALAFGAQNGVTFGGES